MYLDLPEFAGKIAAYYDAGCGGSETSMHGPAVASLLVGENCGTAPGANVYYVAAPSWLGDAAYEANGLDWIIQQNEGLPESDKIRIVSVSAAPSNRPTNGHMWDEACVRAEAAGILVLDVTRFAGPCWYDANDPENVAKCTPGFPGMEPYFDPEEILVPASPRTSAEESYEADFSYHYTGRGGVSWSMPYCAGVLAMGWQICPELTGDQMVDLLSLTAYTAESGAQIINPPAFISFLEANSPVIQLSAEDIEFCALSSGPSPEPQILSISNGGLGALNWVIDYNCDWLEVNPDAGTSTGATDVNEVALTVTALPLGVHSCELIISDPCATNDPQTVLVTLYVADANRSTIQSAIDDANDGDTVIVPPGVYIGDGNRDLDFKGKAITVRSVAPKKLGVVAATIIYCQGTETEPHRGFYFHSNEDANSILAGLTIRSGYESSGGAIYCDNSSPTIINCILLDNSADWGGGMYCRNCGPTVINGIFADNSANYGGGLRNINSSTTVTACTFTGNSVVNWGGGMTNRDCTSSLTVTNCTFTDNSANWGAGMRNYTSSPTVTNCIFSNNTAKSWQGGGMDNVVGADPTLTNCTFSGNSATVRGGGIHNDDTSSSTLTDCILWANTGGTNESAQIHTGSGTSVIDYCCIQGWTGSLGGIGNIGADPCFADANNGDYHLKSEGWRWDSKPAPHWKHDFVTSRCIDAGNPGSPLGAELLTIPGDPNHVWGQNLRINMGAYGGTAKASMPPYDWALLSDITNDGIVDGCDFACQAEDWLVNVAERFGDLNRDTIVAVEDHALFVDDWLQSTTWHQ
jgi:predicted outer membrane repeat protein